MVRSKCNRVGERSWEMAYKELLSEDAMAFPSHMGPFASHFKMQVFGKLESIFLNGTQWFEKNADYCRNP